MTRPVRHAGSNGIPESGVRFGRRPRLAAAAALLGVALVSGWVARAGAQEQGACTGQSVGKLCVMLIQVAGLEPKDVTKQTTPFLWGLSDPGDVQNPASQVLGGGRSGFIWQAPRAVMSAGKAANTAALLTGSYPEQSGIPSDEFMGDAGRHVRLGAPETEAADVGPLGAFELQQDSLFELLNEQRDDIKLASIVGDPALADLATTDVDEGRKWSPEAPCPKGAQSKAGDQCAPTQESSPLCPIPRNPSNPDPRETEAARVGCIAPDLQTLNEAFTILNDPNNDDLGFTFIHLAELGAVKRSSTDLDSSPPDQDPQTQPVAHALAQTDAALATFFGRLTFQNQSVRQRLANTVIMVVGDSGWERTLPNNRVPHPTKTGEDLANFVGEFNSEVAGFPSGTFELFPQGTVATVYCESGPGGGCPTDAKAPSDAYKDALKELKSKIEAVDNTCKSQPGGASCIQEVLYMRPELAPAGSTETVQAKHFSWHLDHQNEDPETGDFTGPSGFSGDLLVVTKPGWATGKTVPTSGDLAGQGADADSITNPYPASTGGPRNRAVAALINGPAGSGTKVVQVNQDIAGGRYPVIKANNPDGDEIDPGCPGDEGTDRNFKPDPAFEVNGPLDDGLAQANATPSDDANAEGRWCQAETVDFAPTIAALLKVNMPAEQLAGRVLNEVFDPNLTFPIEREEAFVPPPPTAYFISGPISAAGWEQNKELKAITRDRTPTFEFSADFLPAKFECQVDGGGWFECGSPHTITPELSFGDHAFQIRASTVESGLGPAATAVFEVVPPPSPEAYFITGPISGAGWERNKKLKAITPVRTPTFEFSSNILPATFECQVDGGGWFACGSPHTVTPELSFGMHALQVRATTIEGGLGPTATAIFEVVEEFSFGGLIRNVDAKVSDMEGRGVGQARAGTPLDHLTITADFGKPVSLVGLSFYRRKRGHCGSVLAPDSVTAAAARKAKRAGKDRGGKSQCKISTVATFDPFVIERGHVVLRLRVPERFTGKQRPDYAGIAVRKAVLLTDEQRARCLEAERQQCKYKPDGKTGGGIFRVRGARWLHKVAEG